MRRGVMFMGLFSIFGVGCKSGTVTAAPAQSKIVRDKPAALAPVPRDKLCMTRGDATAGDAGLRISDPTTRGVASASSGEAVALRFTYRGETAETAKLASGSIRHQVGVKLRAADGCNVVYVMWRVEPRPFIEVSVKRNPGVRTHAECGANGYTKVKPARTDAVPAFTVDVEHTLEAAIDGDTLTAKLDGAVVWEGELPAEARELDGPAGFRSDNMQYDFELSVAPASRKRAATPGCGGGDSDD